MDLRDLENRLRAHVGRSKKNLFREVFVNDSSLMRFNAENDDSLNIVPGVPCKLEELMDASAVLVTNFWARDV